MKASELRIGNFVRGKSPGRTKYEEPVTLCPFYLYAFTKEPKRVHLEPIPLTEEWLERFGFVKIIHSIKSTELKDEYNKGFVRVSHYFGGYDFKGSTRIKHVHQLQNLYFALTGEELTPNNTTE